MHGTITFGFLLFARPLEVKYLEVTSRQISVSCSIDLNIKSVPATKIYVTHKRFPITLGWAMGDHSWERGR